MIKSIKYPLLGGPDDYIQLIQLLKAANLVESGADAQAVVVEGMFKRNGEVELRKRAKCVPGDIVEFNGIQVQVTAE